MKFKKYVSDCDNVAEWFYNNIMICKHELGSQCMRHMDTFNSVTKQNAEAEVG
jgi:hypothetical protein